MEIKRIIINKNRGWRGLAELRCEDSEGKEVAKMIFSFSQPVWNDLLEGYIVLQHEENYIVLNFDNLGALPRPDQQRSVLIKYFTGNVIKCCAYSKTEWRSKAQGHIWVVINHFTRNRNNHTTSDWNNIGVRVIPNI